MGGLRESLAPVLAAARGRWYPHGTRHRRSYRRAVRLLLALVALGPLVAAGWTVLVRPGAWRAVTVVAAALLLALGALVAFALIDRLRPGRAPWWKAAGALVLSPVGAVVGTVSLLRGRTGLPAGTVVWADMPNDEDRGASSKVRPVVVVADRGGDVLIRWFTSQDKSSRHDYVEFTTADQRACGLDGVGRSTWLSTEARALPRTALREPVGAVPPALLGRRPA